ncbi:MAG: siroheme synthase [Fibrobacterales bacterium]|nr:siroheme synthase [Fibrobacterales bacterium]
MKEAILIIAHHSIVPGAYKGFEEILDRLHHELPEARVSSTSLLDLENDLRAILSEGAESVTLLPWLLLNGRHAKNDVPETIARVKADFPDREISLLPCVGDWNAFADMVVSGLRAFRREKRALREEKNASSSSARGRSLLSMELDLAGRAVLVVGGGRIALRKVRNLLPTGAEIDVVAPQIDPELEALAAERPEIRLSRRPYAPGDLDGAALAFVCTDKPAVNRQVRSDARERKILVNNACDYRDGDFIVPARLDFGEKIAVTVSTEGRAPALAKRLKREIQESWKEPLERIEREFSGP